MISPDDSINDNARDVDYKDSAYDHYIGTLKKIKTYQPFLIGFFASCYLFFYWISFVWSRFDMFQIFTEEFIFFYIPFYLIRIAFVGSAIVSFLIYRDIKKIISTNQYISKSLLRLLTFQVIIIGVVPNFIHTLIAVILLTQLIKVHKALRNS